MNHGGIRRATQDRVGPDHGGKVVNASRILGQLGIDQERQAEIMKSSPEANSCRYAALKSQQRAIRIRYTPPQCPAASC